MKNNTLYASEITYEFEKARISGSENVLKAVKNKITHSYPEKLDYLDDFYDKETGTSATAFKDKDTGEIILAYTGTNMDSDGLNDVVKTDVGEIGLGIGGRHYDPAYKFYEKIREEYGEDITLTGHSLGGNIAQRVALEYNAPKTIVYNSAPLYIPNEQLMSVLSIGLAGNFAELILKKSGMSIKDAIAYPIGLIKDGTSWILGIQTEETKIKKLEKTFTGQVIRIQAEADILNNVSDYVRGKYLGIEYVLKNAGWHLLVDILNSEEQKEELEKITKQLGSQKVDIDIDGDGKVDIKLGSLDLKRKNLLNDKVSITSKEKIQLSPETLKTLSKNIQTKVLGDLATIKNITKLCIEKNNKVRINFNQRKEKVTESIKEEINNTGMPIILETLRESIGEIINNKDILEKLNKYHEIKMEKFSANEKPLVNGGELNPVLYNIQLATLRYAVEPLLNQCINEKTTDISNLFSGRPTILKSWQEIENNTKRLIEESDKTFEGDGLRTGKEDGISQSLRQVLEIANKNIEELEKQLQNTAKLTQGLAENFEEQDRWIKEKIDQGVFIGSNPVRNMPQSYKAYLERDEIFDDVKDVIQAFDKQVEKRSKEYAEKVTKITGESLDVFTKGIENWVRLVGEAEKITKEIEGNYSLTVEVEEKYTEDEETKTRTRYWGKLEKLYPEEVVTNTAGIQEKILSKKGKIEQTLEKIKSTQNNLSQLEPNLKKIIEKGVYKAFDLEEIVNSQKITIQLVEKSKAEINYVKEHIGTEKMSGESIRALEKKIEEVRKSLEYYKMFIGDCFGEQE